MPSNNDKHIDEQAAATAGEASAGGDSASEASLRPQASRWLEQVDGEAERLRRRWNEAQGELARTEAKNRDLDKANAQLRTEVIELERALQKQRDTARAAEGDKDQRIAELEQDLGRRTEALQTLRGALEEAEARAKNADQRLAAFERRHSGSADQVRLLRHELVAQQNLIGKLEAELETKQRTIDAVREQTKAAGSAPTSADGAVISPSEPPLRSDGSEDVEIIRIGGLFRHDSQGGRRPVAALEAPDGTTYFVTMPSITIGRASSNDICIRQEFISRIHARLIVGEIGAIIEDAGSKNGILVNSEPVGRRLLADGDIVSLGGKLDLKFVELDASALTGAPDVPTDANP